MEDSIKVFIRARPSTSSNAQTSISLDEETNTVYIPTGALSNNSSTMNKFQYSGVLGEATLKKYFLNNTLLQSDQSHIYVCCIFSFVGPAADQRCVYSSLGVSTLIQNELLAGVNCCIIAYGDHLPLEYIIFLFYHRFALHFHA